jgi:hypothetical protein
MLTNPAAFSTQLPSGQTTPFSRKILTDHDRKHTCNYHEETPIVDQPEIGEGIITSSAVR